MSITRPILINNESGIILNNKMTLTHNLKRINTFNVNKYSDVINNNLNGIEFASITNSKTELKFNDIEYEFSKLIITNDFDTYDTDNSNIDPSYAIIMEFNKLNTQNYKLYITIPIINSVISSNETLNYIVGYLDDTDVINDISAGNNLICNIPNSNLNDMIPKTEFLYYSIQQNSEIQNHILIDSENSTLSIDYNNLDQNIILMVTIHQNDTYINR